MKIVVPESREIDLLAGLLEAEGAVAVRCPLVRIVAIEDFAGVDAWLRMLVAGSFDDLVLFTGEGVRHLARRADTLGLKPQFVTALARARTIIRGPKPARALRELGLDASVSAPSPTSEGLIEAFAGSDLAGRRIGVQLYPGHGGEEFAKALEHRGAVVTTVIPYRYASQTETDDVADMIAKMAAGAFDMIAFTSSPQVARLAEVARERHIEDALAEGLKRMKVAAIGPVVAHALETLHVTDVVMPARAFHLKPLVRAIVAAMQG